MTTGPVALFIPALDGGGGERITLQLAAELQAAGEHIELVVGSTRGPLLPEVPSSVTVVDLGCERLRSALPPLVRYLRRQRPVAILPTIEHASVLCLVAVRLARTDTKVIVRVANTLSELRPADGLSFRRLNQLLVRRLYPRADTLVACSNGMADDVASLTGTDRSRIKVIPNATVGPGLEALREVPVDHPWFGGDRPVVLGVGKLRQQKDFALLIDAFASVRRRRPARLVILGEGPERRALTAQVARLGLQDDVDLPGFEANPYRYMAGADVFVLSSAWEGLPGVLIEAMACGTSVVATDCPSGPREILEGGAHGWLVPTGQADALADAILDALEHPRPPSASAWAPFTAAASAERYLELVGSHAPGREVRDGS